MFFAEVSRVEQRVPRDNNAPITCCGNLVTISRKVTETDSQKLLLNSITVNNNYLREPCAYQRACEVKLPEPRLIARSQLGRFLQNVMNTNFRD